MGLLTPEHLQAIGTVEATVTVDISRRDIQKYAAATEQLQQKFLDGDEAPPMFIFNLFSDIPQLASLREDGLARSGGQGPKLPLKRVMAGGTKITQALPILPGDTLTGTRTLIDLFEKAGRSGPLIFSVRELAVTNQTGATILTETQTSIAR